MPRAGAAGSWKAEALPAWSTAKFHTLHAPLEVAAANRRYGRQLSVTGQWDEWFATNDAAAYRRRYTIGLVYALQRK